MPKAISLGTSPVEVTVELGDAVASSSAGVDVFAASASAASQCSLYRFSTAAHTNAIEARRTRIAMKVCSRSNSCWAMAARSKANRCARDAPSCLCCCRALPSEPRMEGSPLFSRIWSITRPHARSTIRAGGGVTAACAAFAAISRTTCRVGFATCAAISTTRGPVTAAMAALPAVLSFRKIVGAKLSVMPVYVDGGLLCGLRAKVLGGSFRRVASRT